MCVQAFGSELAVKAFDEAVVRRLTRSREVQNDAFLIGPEIEIARDKLRSLINTDCFWIANIFADALECLNNILAPIAKTRIHNRRESTKRIDNRQDADLGSGGQLIMDKVHRPCLVDLNSISAVISELCPHSAFGNLIPQLQTHFLIKAINPFWVDLPSITFEQDVDTSITVTHTRLANISDLDLQIGLIVPPGLVVINRSCNAKSATSPSG